MVIGLDIDGTIDRHSEFFAFLSNALLHAGHRVIVVTFREDRTGRAASDMRNWKGTVCRECGIEILFDDDPEVLTRIDPGVVGLMVVDHDEHDLERLIDMPAGG